MTSKVQAISAIAESPESAPSRPPLPRLDGLQLGRAVAACGVAIAHGVVHYYGGGFGVWALLGQYGVILFFVISGFIMVMTTGRGSFRPGRFMSRRIRRIVPIYYVANLILVAGTLTVPDAFTRTIFDFGHLIRSLLFIPAYDPAGTGLIIPFFKLGWTLNYEMFFYVLFASLFALNAWQRGLAIVTLLGGLIVIGTQVDFDSAILAFYTRAATAGFAFGVILGLVTLYRPDVVFNLGASAAAAIVGLCIAVLAWILSDYGHVRTEDSTTFLLSFVAALNVLLLVAVVDGWKWNLPAPLLYLGDASYSIYLFHMFAIGVMTIIAHRLPEILLYPMLALSGLAGIASGVVAYWLLESPLNQFFRQRRPLTAAQLGPEQRGAAE